MNDKCFIENNVTQSATEMKYTAKSSLTKYSTANKHWSASITIIIVGLPALLFFLAMGGMFALIGPWIILIGIQSVRIQPGCHLLRFITGGGFLILGVIALLFPIKQVVLGHVGGLALLLLGLAYLITTLFVLCKKI